MRGKTGHLNAYDDEVDDENGFAIDEVQGYLGEKSGTRIGQFLD